MDGGKYTSSWRLRKKAVLCGEKEAVLEGEKEAFLDGEKKFSFKRGRYESVLGGGQRRPFLKGGSRLSAPGTFIPEGGRGEE